MPQLKLFTSIILLILAIYTAITAAQMLLYAFFTGWWGLLVGIALTLVTVASFYAASSLFREKYTVWSRVSFGVVGLYIISLIGVYGFMLVYTFMD